MFFIIINQGKFHIGNCRSMYSGDIYIFPKNLGVLHQCNHVITAQALCLMEVFCLDSVLLLQSFPHQLCMHLYYCIK